MLVSPSAVKPISSHFTSTSHFTKEYSAKRGSLPLKKRRFIHDNVHTSESESAVVTPVRSTDSDSSLEQGDETDERIAALALVAAAASRSAIIPLTDTPAVLSQPTIIERTESPPVPELSSASGAPKRMNRPPLASPLPGGCHGRTSRNNSYCRRLPCYNGSKYCKLHYQQYILAGGRPPSAENPGKASHGFSFDQAPALPLLQAPIPVAHQDKRYTGSGTETRCQATTTRGRACAYVSVNGTKYCYLHADYDTNPPPRRGSTCAPASPGSSNRLVEMTCKPIAGKAPIPRDYLSSKVMGKNKSISKPFAGHSASMGTPAALATMQDSPASSSTSDGHNTKTTSLQSQVGNEKALGSKSLSRRASKNMEKHADSPYPLLSMISTDQWYQKLVVISAGPLANRVGRVEKWGNGWVSVRLASGGLHNRRSFELYLHPRQECDKGKEGSEIFLDVNYGEVGLIPRPNQDLLHRNRPKEEDGKPEIVFANQKTTELSVQVTAEVSSKEMNTSKEGDQADGTVPSLESENMNSVSLYPRTGEALPDTCQQHQELRSPNDVTLTSSSRSDIERSESPLAKSLIIAQEQGIKRNNRLDLLFGTAALERSRRTVQKPSRYEDTAMIVKKRENEVIDEASAKRQRFECAA